MTDERREIVRVDTKALRDMIERRRLATYTHTYVTNEVLESLLLELDTLRRWVDSKNASNSRKRQDSLQSKAQTAWKRSQRNRPNT